MMSDYTNINGDVAYFEGAEEALLSDWLLNSFSTLDFSPASISPYHAPNVEKQMSDLFHLLSARAQEKLRHAITDAIAEWHPKLYSVEVLRSLSFLMSATRSLTAVVPLRGHLHYDRIHDPNPDTETAALRAVTGTISALAPHPYVEDALRDYYFSSHFDPRFAPTILRGLCICAPQKYAEYLPQFLALSENEKYRDYYDKAIVMEKVVEAVPIPTLIEHLSDLGEEEEPFLESIILREPPVIVIVPDGAGIHEDRTYLLVNPATGKKYAAKLDNHEDTIRLWMLLAKMKVKQFRQEQGHLASVSRRDNLQAS